MYGAEDAPPGQTTWVNAGSSDGTANETGPSISTQEFYTSGANGQFTIINGAYQPVIQMAVSLDSCLQTAEGP